ncbi:copper resistance CopC family protein [Planococcus sp. FY231025]|uniref:copper resistance CopC family protein n=1 Tax=Planococcus sp. FY231025 TaxID=3455699 RepID=UPI003F93C7F5
MMKKIMMLLVLFLVLTPFAAHAHTALTDSNPASGETLAEQPGQIELVFNTDIEEGSSMALQGPNGAVEVADLSLNGNMMFGSVATNLENGSYTISWKIIGADGHPIEGEVPFSVEIATEAVEEPAEEPAAAEPSAEPAATEKQAGIEGAAAESGEENGFLTIGIVLLLVILAGASILLLVKRKR